MQDPSSGAQAQQNEDPALEQQREEAVKAILEHDLDNADIALEQGLLNLQSVALEEGIRTTLEEYREYGVPPGETRLVTATKNILECQNEVNQEKEECEAQDGFIGRAACKIAAGLDKLDCIADEVVDRYL